MGYHRKRDKFYTYHRESMCARMHTIFAVQKRRFNDTEYYQLKTWVIIEHEKSSTHVNAIILE